MKKKFVLSFLLVIVIFFAGSVSFANAKVSTLPTASLTANGKKSLTVNVGDSVTFTWSSKNATTATSTFKTNKSACGKGIGPSKWGAGNTVSGTVGPIAIPACSLGRTYTYTYKVTQSSTGKKATATLVLKVNGKTQTQTQASAPTINYFTANPPYDINQGVSSTLSWSITGANTVSIDQGIGSVNVNSGVQSVSPTLTTTYTITATNSSGSVTAKAKVTINAQPAPATNSFNG